MKTFDYTIRDPLGLHARPVGLLVKHAKESSCEIVIKCGERSSSAKRLFSLMGMGVKCGERVTVEVEGKDEISEAQELENFFYKNF